MRHLNFPYTFFSTLELWVEEENDDPELYKAYFTKQENKDVGAADEIDCEKLINRIENGKVPSLIE